MKEFLAVQVSMALLAALVFMGVRSVKPVMAAADPAGSPPLEWSLSQPGAQQVLANYVETHCQVMLYSTDRRRLAEDLKNEMAAQHPVAMTPLRIFCKVDSK